MKIEKIEVGTIHSRLKKPFITSLRRIQDIEDILVKVTLEDGTVGYGEAAPTAVITGDTLDSMRGAIKGHIAPNLIGEDIFSMETIDRIIQKSIIGNVSAKAAVDIAVYDAFTKKLGIPLYKYLGGHTNKRKTDITISLNDIETMLQDAKEAVEDGYCHLKIKVGHGKREDIETIHALRNLLGPKPKLLIDANQAWSPKESVEIIKAIEGAGITLVEQPVHYEDIDGLDYVTKHSIIPVMADESVYSVKQTMEIINRRAADIINIKLMKTGGINQANIIANLATARNIPCMMGCMMEAGLSTLAALHLASAKGIIHYVDLDPFVLNEKLPFETNHDLSGPEFILSDDPGLGLTNVEGVFDE